MRSSKLCRGSLLLLAATQFTNAHTWIEEMRIIAPNGTYTGATGYARGNALRTGSVDANAAMVYLTPPDGDRPVNDILPTDLICKSSQTSQTQTDGSPRLQAPAGAMVALRYLENGHVTLPQNQAGKPSNRGTNYVYGTTQSSPDDSLLAIHRQWTPDGTGGDGRGALISTSNFDDGQCYENNNGALSNQRVAQFPIPNAQNGAKLMCQQDIALPSDLKSGTTYTLYWVWDWPTMPGTSGFPNGKQEIYTTCMDIDIIDAPVGAVNQLAVQYAVNQDFSNAAVSGQLIDIANPTRVASAQTIPFTASATGPASGQAAAQSAAPTTIDNGSGHGSTPVVVTSSFTVYPIGGTIPAGATAAAASPVQPTAATQPPSSPASGPSKDHGGSGSGSASGGWGWGAGNGNGNYDGNGSGQPDNNVAATGVDTGSVPMLTYTQWDTATETVFQTVYQTQYTKRTNEFNPTDVAGVDAPTPTADSVPLTPRSIIPTCSQHHRAFRLRARRAFGAKYADESAEC